MRGQDYLMVTLKEEFVSIAQGTGIHKVGFTSKERLQDAPLSWLAITV